MSSTILKTLLISLITFNLYPQEYELIGPPGNHPFDIEIDPLNGNIVYCGTESGILFRSIDSGIKTQYIYNHPVSLSTHILINPFNSNLIYSGNSRSFDRGNSWEEMSLDLYTYDYVINPENPQTVYAISSFNFEEIWLTKDAGNTWALLKDFNTRVNSLAISPSDTSTLYCFADYALQISINGGIDWNKVIDPYPIIEGYNIKVNPINESSILISDWFSLYKSNDQGKTLTNILSTTGHLGDFIIHSQDTSTFYVAGFNWEDYSNIFITTDSGENWSIINNGLPNEYRYISELSISPNNWNELYAGVPYWGTYKTVDSGQNWEKTKLTCASVSDLYVDQDSSNTLYVSQDRLGIMKTNNGGIDWFRLDVPIPTSAYGRFGQFVFDPQNANIAYLCDEFGIYKTIDKGKTWDFVQINFRVGDVEMWSVAVNPFNSQHILAGEKGFFQAWLHESLDNGATWDTISIPFTYAIYQILFDRSAENVIYLSAGEAGILKSIDSGMTWDPKNSGLIHNSSGFYLTANLTARTDSSSILYLAQRSSPDRDGGIFKSIDGGDDWNRIDQSIDNKSAFAVAISPFDQNVVYVLLENDGLYRTNDDGDSWHKICDIFVSSGVGNIINFDNNDYNKIYVKTEYGVALVVDTLVSSLNNNIKKSPKRYTLSQNYPNPFNPKTVLNYQLPVMSEVDLIIYNILGEKVTTLVSETQNAGIYIIEWDADQLPSGVYYSVLKAGEYSSVIKMMLLK